jgi:ankyrin repeat protein
MSDNVILTRIYRYGKTVLMWAAEFGRIEIVRKLIDKSANVNAVDAYGWTALMYATRGGCIEMFGMLIEKGANTDAADNQGFTALMKATTRCNVEMVKILIEKGAEVGSVKFVDYRMKTEICPDKLRRLEEIRTILKDEMAKSESTPSY